MRLVLFTCLVLIGNGAMAQTQKKIKAPTAADSELATRCARAATTAVESARLHPTSRKDRDDFVLAVGEAMRAADSDGPMVPSKREMFSAQFSMEITLREGFSPDTNAHDMVGHAAATCAVVEYKNR